MTEIDEAIRLLEGHGGYAWLVNAPADFSFSATSIVEHLAKTGVEVTKRTVQDWIRDLPHTAEQGGLGLYATRNDLIMLFAGRIRGRKLA
jgi:hypothetical protein